mmetsp:Transcript_31731/g.63367  ORF Transcript_31731/g.63367 Transcript_31731/m.63367 type:complete len:590 (-) Transcript_31731:1569-3338(-)
MEAINADGQEENGRWTAGPTPKAPVADAARAFDAAFAVLGGRFRHVKHALKHEEFSGADHPLTVQLLENMRENQDAVTAAIEEEEQRVAKVMAEATAFSTDAERRSDLVWLEGQFTLLLCVATADALTMAEDERLRFGWIFKVAELEDRRYYAYKFMYSVYTALLDTAAGGFVVGGPDLHDLAKQIFGCDAAYTIRHIRQKCIEGKSEPEPVGRRANFPRDVEAVLFKYVAKLRALTCPVYRCFVIDYAKRLIYGTFHALDFARQKGGEYILDEDGYTLWDEDKLNHWFYRRFLGDRAWDGAGTGRQRILDVHRAKWRSFKSMKPYYICHVQALVEHGICEWNKNYCEQDVDVDGVPREPIAFWVASERWRAASFDEMRLDDKTHGDGGDRKGRTENTVRAGKWDAGETIGQKSASHTASLVGGSNALHEPLVPFVCLACSDFNRAILLLGPIAVINGKRFHTQGTCNPKGSINGKAAIQLVDQSLLPAFEAHRGLTSSRKAVVACDGVGTHMTLEFLEHCQDHYIVLVLRTPYCSQVEQFEDLVNFWDFKNTKDVGWYKRKQSFLPKQLKRTFGCSSTLDFQSQVHLW